MSFKTVIVTETGNSLTLTLNRPEKQNAINKQILKEIHLALDLAESKPECRLVIIQGQRNLFCSGMDLNEVALNESLQDEQKVRAWTSLYMATLKRFATSPKVIVAKVDGKAVAGGLGLIAASDIVVATESAYFKLTEAMWGLLPAMVAPYLIRRVGFQKAYSMALTSRSVTAQEALSIHLIDELSENLDEAISRIIQQIKPIEIDTIQEMKAYFRKLWIIDEDIEQTAIDKTAMKLLDPAVQGKLHRFLKAHQLPWELSH